MDADTGGPKTVVRIKCHECGEKYTLSIDRYIPVGVAFFAACPRCPILVEVTNPMPNRAPQQRIVFSAREEY